MYQREVAYFAFDSQPALRTIRAGRVDKTKESFESEASVGALIK